MRRPFALFSSALVATPVLVASTLSAPVQAAPQPAAAPPVSQISVPAATALLSAKFADETPKLKRTETWVDGTTYAHYDRTYKGLRVVGGSYAVPVKLGPKGSAFGAGVGQPIGHEDVQLRNTSPRISAGAARDKGKGAAAREDGALPATATTKPAELVVHIGADGQAKLAYDVYTEGPNSKTGLDRIHTFIDANSGAVLARNNLVRAGSDSGTGLYNGKITFSTVPLNGSYVLRDGVGNATRDMKHQDVYNANFYNDGVEIYRKDNGDDIWGSGTLFSGDKQSIDAQFGLEMTYAFYKNVLGRAGEAGDGKGTPARMHAGVKKDDGTIEQCWSNATWDGWHINFGDGAGCSKPFSEIDIVAHEFTHGVTYYSADLQYELEAGGLNESMSDIFGMMVERYANMNGRSNDTWDYHIGEKLNYYNNGAPLRFMDRPNKDGISYNCWDPKFAQRDAYGNELVDVHFSSGPMNHAFYLLAEGSGAKTINNVAYDSPTCNGAKVTGVGPDAAAKIVYGALTSPSLSPTATYLQFRDEMVRAAIAKYGATSSQCYATEAAMSAINVAPGATSPRCTQPTSPAPLFPRDVTGDRKADIMLVSPTGGLNEMAGNGTGTFAAPVQKSTADYRTMKHVVQVGPWDAAGAGDLWAVQNTDKLWLKTRRAETGNWDSGNSVIGCCGWTTYTQLFAPGDLNKDGLGDVMSVDNIGILWYYRHTPDGMYAARAREGAGWSVYTKVFTAGDMNRDGIGDVLAIDTYGRLWFYAGNGDGHLRARELYGQAGWSIYSDITSVGDMDGDGWSDVVALDKSGVLWRYHYTGNKNLATRYQVRSGMTGWRLVH